ncbi:hypothetical protein [Paratractidigestivibacter sp.]|uniref:hypothetical protein n=1 Tax=Paratractidigestivibacter sp. TaxID=2847316 RepID=UPI002AC9676C|nr:hypothetical protein [Paratractidigestivibacter sp.]
MADLRGIALGQMGMTRREFYEMPLGEFLEALESHSRKVEADRRHIGELVRGAALRLFNVQLRRKDQIKEPSKFWQMPWDGDDELQAYVPMTKEESDRAAKSLLEKIGW